MPDRSDTTPARCYAVVPCAGVGQRAGTAGPKQYARLAGQPVVAHTLAALAAVPALQATLVVLAAEDQEFERRVPQFEGVRAWVARCGGATRAASVGNGLAQLRQRGARDHDWVLVHDAARCLVRASWVQALIEACRGDEVGGLLALPLADTLKQAGGQRATATLPRADKWLAQTPQMFRLGLLQRALAEAGPEVTDESGAVEALGLAPLLVPGDLENFKLTWPADFALAERLLENRPR
ncbi:MAG: 2-C-methyl-D-erythritol 4-phosphate cytidylyltransferase [Rubrivivax sp.]|nr:2-C-methyl-D-erythritol 4-phosphate cytidylyltransferase [Rubrivivax sp.]